MAPMLLLLGAVAAYAAVTMKPKGAGGAAGGASGPPFANGMPSDKGMDAAARAQIDAVLQQEPNPPGPGGYQVLVNALVQASALLRQNFPRAADAVWARYMQLRAQALANGWRERDGLDTTATVSGAY